MEAKADWPTLRMGGSQNCLRGGDTWTPLCTGKPRAGGVHRRRQLSLARGRTRTNTKGALGHREHPPETGCPSNTLNFPSNCPLGSCLLARGGRETCPAVPCEGHAGQRGVLGWASPCVALKFARLRGTDNWLLTRTPCLTVLQWLLAPPASSLPAQLPNHGTQPGSAQGMGPACLRPRSVPSCGVFLHLPPKSCSGLADRESSTVRLLGQFLALAAD